MQQIADWLEKLGMSEYAKAFADNGIEVSVLPHLTDQDLKDIGVLLGHRRKMLAAIAKFVGAVETPPQSAPTQRKLRDTAERRQVTVMFSDLVGSTALSARMDPEDLREVISAYQNCVAETVRRFGGFIAKYMGDGVLIYFGYPRADEHDSERAVRAGLALVEAVPKLETAAGSPLQVRIGVATGLVVVGDLIGAGAAQEQAVVGETPNLAARLQALAEPGAVVIASSTRGLTGGLFEYRDLGTVALKGFAENVSAWQVLGASGAESRFEALRSATALLVGRNEEMELLLRRWEQAKRGNGCVVLISGEPGIGKSHITQTVQERLQDEPHTRIRYFCSPHHQDSALYPFIAQLERAGGFGRDNAPETKLAKLEEMLGQATTLPQEVGLIAELLSLPTAGRYQLPPLSPQMRRERTLAALLAHVVGLAAHRPVLMLFEDVHWIDPSSLELLSLAVERASGQSVLMVITARPEFTVPWPDRSHVETLVLTRLDRSEGTALVRRVAGNRALPEEVMNRILARTDGVPLFLEELTRTVLESGLLREQGGAFVLTGPLPPLAIPTTLHASLLARLDRLPAARAVAQVGAALGRQFRHDLIAAVAPMPETQLRDSMSRLVASELMFRHGTDPDVEYTFKHALVQDAAYSTLLRSQRQQLHDRIATTLERQFPEFAAGQPEIVARHCTEAGLTDAAIDWWRKAGELALRRSAFGEAVAHFHKAIGLADGLADSPAHRLRRLRLQTIHAQALVHARGQTAPETTAAFTRARELAAEVDNPAERFPAYYGLWVISYARTQLFSMRESADAMLSDAQRWPGSPEACIAHQVVGITRWFEGDYVSARVHLEQALAGYDPDRDRHLAARFGFDPGVVAMGVLVRVLWGLGDMDRAVHLVEQGLGRALQIAHLPSIAFAQFATCFFAALRRKPGQAAPHAQALVALAREHGLPQWLAYGTFCLGWVLWCAGDREGELRMCEGLELLREQQVHNNLRLFYVLLAQVEAESGRLEVGLATLNAEHEAIERTGERWFHAEVHRVRGELLLRREPPDSNAAAAAFMLAIDIAQRQKARTFELRAAVALATIYKGNHQDQAARRLLEQALVGFGEVREFPEVAEANRLLASLAPLARVST